MEKAAGISGEEMAGHGEQANGGRNNERRTLAWKARITTGLSSNTMSRGRALPKACFGLETRIAK